MKLAIIGNCQIAPLRQLVRAMVAYAEIPALPAVHTMDERHRNLVEKSVYDADWVIAQQVSDDYPVDYVRTSSLRKEVGEKLVVWPNLYFTGYAPEYNTLRDSKYKNFTGPLLDYHSDKILFGFFRGLSVTETIKLVSEVSILDEMWYSESVSKSLQNLRGREKTGDILIADFIEERFASERLFYIMNHPSMSLIQEVAIRILTLTGINLPRSVPASMFMDMELVSALHPENPYIREKHGLKFPASRFYRGARLVASDSSLGIAPDGSLIYDDAQMVTAMFDFYERYKFTLPEHGRVKEILSRAVK